MEYKLDLLQKRVTHLEDLIISINDKIGVVLDEFFTHRAKQAADLRQKSQDEETLCLSLLSKFKSCFEVTEQRCPSTTLSDNAQRPTVLATPNCDTNIPITLPAPVLVSSAVSAVPTSALTTSSIQGIQASEIERPDKDVEEIIDQQKKLQDENVEEEVTEQEAENDQIQNDTSENSIIVNQVFGNYSDPDPEASSDGEHEEHSAGGIENENEIEEEVEDNNHDTTLDEDDPLDAPHSAADGDDSDVVIVAESDHGQQLHEVDDDEILSLLCDPEIVIKTENTASSSFDATTDQLDQVVDQNDHQPEEPEPEDGEDMNQDPEPDQPGSGGSLSARANAQGYRRARSFKNIDAARMFVKINGIIARGSTHDATEARHYYFRCKDKNCSRFVYLAESYVTGQVTMYERSHHNHPPIRVELSTPKGTSMSDKEAGGSGKTKPTATKTVPTFKLKQTFANRAEAMAKIQAEEPGAWILNQVVECPDSVKAYYNCGLQSGHSCPMSMVLRTFNANGKVDHYVWQGEHVHDDNSGASAALDFADYFTPPETNSVASGKHGGKVFKRVRSYETEEEARAEVAVDTNDDARWDLRNTHHTITGKKMYYYCKRRKCPMTMYLQYVTLAGKVFQYVSGGEHDHSHPDVPPKAKLGPGRRKSGRSGRPPGKEYAVVATFATELEARAHVRNELAWVFRNSFRIPGISKKMYYLCKHDPKCPVRCILTVNVETGVTQMCVTTKEAHVHLCAPRPKLGGRGKKIKLAPELRSVIDEMYAAGLTTVEKILKELERRGTPLTAPPYHVFGYLARLRRAKFGRGKGGRKKGGAKTKTKTKKMIVPSSRVLSGNPRNERARQAQAQAAAAKRITASTLSTAMKMNMATQHVFPSLIPSTPTRRLTLSMSGDGDGEEYSGSASGQFGGGAEQGQESKYDKALMREKCLRMKAFVNVKRLEM